MGCPARRIRKSFLGFSWNAELGHKWIIKTIESKAFGFWVVKEQCEFCTCNRVIHFFDDEKIFRYIGFLPKVGISGIIYTHEIDEQRGLNSGNKS